MSKTEIVVPKTRMFGTLGFGKFISPRFSLEAELNYQNPDKTVQPELVVEPVRRVA